MIYGGTALGSVEIAGELVFPIENPAKRKLHSLRRFMLKNAYNPEYHDAFSEINGDRNISGSDAACFTQVVSLTSNQSAFSLGFNDMRAIRRLYIETDGSIKAVFNGTASVIIGLTSASMTVGKPMAYLEGSVTSLSFTNRVARQTQVFVLGSGSGNV